MLKAQYNERGPVPQESITAVEFEAPTLADDEALVELIASPINPSDVLTLTGEYGILPPLPAIGGNEGVGKIVKLGGKGPAIGQTVMLPAGSGTWATHMVCKTAQLIPVPNEADAKQLAMMTINPPTALLMLEEFVDLQPGDWVIQNAANSGVGSYLIQLAKIKGLKTINVVRRESAVEGVKAQGADVVLVDGPKLAKQVAELTGDNQPKLGIDAVGGSSTDRIAASLAMGGTLVNYGLMSGEPCQVSANSFVFRDVTLKGFWLARWFRNATPEKQKAVFGQIIKYIAEGKLKTKIHAEYPVSEIKQAVAAAAEGGREGKILVVA
ncbi:zinc-dependent alcohol dehydrogenase family protein [uncultured Zhongshania sp.]|uniref:zinc-dependent alcohol dehydrogenase family protein n=1 Tax=uncultured Zhongshania sp. TaxID=1642288 RepID=UPI0025E29F17|nr:zinc-dependent alcohol dehydrogenase family protein [uncultured Zhongshania sp.]